MRMEQCFTKVVLRMGGMKNYICTAVSKNVDDTEA